METKTYVIVTKDDPWDTFFLQDVKKNLWTDDRYKALIINSKFEAEEINKKFKGIIKEVEILKSGIVNRPFTVLDWK